MFRSHLCAMSTFTKGICAGLGCCSMAAHVLITMYKEGPGVLSQHQKNGRVCTVSGLKCENATI
jgi:hypothetical protein